MSISIRTTCIVLLLAVGILSVPVVVFYVARSQVAMSNDTRGKPSQLRFSHFEFSRTVGMQIYFRGSASADAHLRKLLTKQTPVWSLIPHSEHRAQWLIHINTGDNTWWADDDYPGQDAPRAQVKDHSGDLSLPKVSATQPDA